MSKFKCEHCGKCCNHVTVEIDKPEDKEDFEEIKWFVLHKNVSVFIDDDGEWNVQFITPCKARKDNKCEIHTKRPSICKDYDPEECEFNGEGEYYEIMFTKPSEVEDYMKMKFKKKKS